VIRLHTPSALLPALLVPLVAASVAAMQDGSAPRYPDAPEGAPPPVAAEGSSAASEDEMTRYTERITEADVEFALLPIRGGTFVMGSPDGEKDRNSDEGPQREVQVSPFWMGVHEVRWDEYRVFMDRLDIQLRASETVDAAPQAPWADAVSRPTPPYVPMDFGMGVEGYPAVCMTQFAAKQYTKWLSMKTGRFYRLPTEAEWEYACRAGTTTAYSWGDDPKDVDDYAVYFDNGDDQYAKVGTKKPNPWGLFDMHGNVAEWTLDAHGKSYAPATDGALVDPLVWPKRLYPRVVRGGSWDDDIEDLRSGARKASRKGWKVQDPQLPKSIWYHTDAPFVGFRVVRPLVEPSDAEKAKYWDADLEEVLEIQDKQRRGER